MGLILLALPLTLGADAPGPEQAGVLVDQVVATVNQIPITASQVALEAAIRKQIAGADEPEVFGRLLSEGAEPLEALIFRAILGDQPKTRSVHIEGDSEATRRLQAFEASFESHEEARSFQQSWGLSDTMLVDYFQEAVLLDAAIDLAVSPKVTEEEERQYYEKNKDRMFGGRPLAEVSYFVSQQVYLLKFEGEYNAWRARLRAGATKRYLGR